MKKSHVFAVCLAVLCLCLWGCGGKKPDTLELVEKKGKLVVALSGESEGDMSRAWAESLEREVIESLGSRLGVEVLYEYMEEGQGVQAVAEGRADIAAGAVILEESGNTGYSITYGCRPVYIATVSGGVSFPGELAKSKVGFDPGVGQRVKNQLYSVTGLTIEDVDNADLAEASIGEGKIAGYICGEAEARKLLSRGGLAVRDFSGIQRESYAFYAGEEQYRMLSELNRLLTEKLKD